MQVHQPFADFLRRQQWESFRTLQEFTGGEIVRAAGPRITRRISITGEPGLHEVYLKQHFPVAWPQRLKPWLRLTPVVLGARPEWDAILKFHAVGIPTMTPIAWGEAGETSWLLTAGVVHQENLQEWTQRALLPALVPETPPRVRPESSARLRKYVEELAGQARTMHAAGLHHQDFYLNHVLLSEAVNRSSELRIIDLGRVREQQPLGRRWILKDLAQLNYSARHLPCSLRLRFLRCYLQRGLASRDRRLIWWLEQKAAQIGRHTHRRGL